jgi:hypothetical protein
MRIFSVFALHLAFYLSLHGQIAVSLVKRLETAHHKKQFVKHDAIAIELDFYTNGKKSGSGRLLSATNSSRMVFERDGKASIWFDGQDNWRSPAKSDNKLSKSSLLTWQYFTLVPFKLRDQGVNWTLLHDTLFLGKKVNAGKLFFKTGTGLTSNDWFRLYLDPETSLLQGMVFISTQGRTVEEALKAMEVVIYSDYRLVDGVPFPHHLEIALWNEITGPTKTLVTAEVKSIKFFSSNSKWFVLPTDRELLTSAQR